MTTPPLPSALPSSLANLTKPTRYLSVVETAKLVRRALKEAFPEVKFSVRSDSYAGGASIRIRWTDGPQRSLVERVAHAFQGAQFDGMQDLKTHRRHTIDGQPVRFGADYVFCDRDMSGDAEAAITAALEALSEDGREQLLMRLRVNLTFYSGREPVRGLVSPVFHAIPTPRFEGRRSALADQVNDITD